MNFADIIKWIKRTPSTPVNVTYDTLHRHVYDVMILDGIDQDFIKNALMNIPNLFGFRIIPENPDDYEVDKSNTDWKNFVYPRKNRDYLIVIFDGSARGFKFGGGACILDEKYHRAGISTAGITSALDMGLRIWHELQHCTDKDNSADLLYKNPSFKALLPAEMQTAINNGKADNRFYLLIYNAFLTFNSILKGV